MSVEALTPNPPQETGTVIGVLDADSVLSATLPELEDAIIIRSSFLGARNVDITELYNKKFYDGIESPDSKSYAWTKDVLTRTTALLLDGKSDSEIASIINIRRPEKELIDAQTVAQIVTRFFSSYGKELIRKASYIRRVNEFVRPSDPETGRKLSVLQSIAKESGVDPAQIFVASARYINGEMPKYRQMVHLEKYLSDPEVAIAMLYEKVVVQKRGEDLREFAEKQIGRPVKHGDVKTFFSKALTKEARAAFGIEKNERSWSKEDYQLIATEIIKNPYITMRELGSMYGVSYGAIAARVRVEGRRMQEESGNHDLSPIALFILTYGDLSKYPGREREVALQTARQFGESGIKSTLVQRRKNGAEGK